MIGYNELYEILRKEKYSEQLQSLPKKFIEEFRDYLEEQKQSTTPTTDIFSETAIKSKKQLENSIALFRELILKRKRKILNLVFVATETGIMKRDYENMLPIEKETFENLIKTFEKGDKEITKILNGSKESKAQEKNKMVLFKENVEPFVDHTGSTIGPFKSGELVNLDSAIAGILVSGDKAAFIDEN